MKTQTLNDIMECDHVIRVNEDGSIDETVEGVRAPEVFVDSAESWQILDEHVKELHESVAAQGWRLLTGYSIDACNYPGGYPIIHPSQYMGGGLEQDIRETPGLYCVVAVEMLPKGEENEDEKDPAPAGWAVAYRES